MKETIYLIAGIILLVIVIYDFFFTTLSGSGAAFLTRAISFVSDRIMQKLLKLTGRRVFLFSGMIVNLTVLTTWVVLTWAGLYFVFSFNPQAITDSDGVAASAVERLYYTGYVLSTLGIGNFKPTTTFFELLTSLFSFYGFVFFTTSMTYLISVSSAVIHKRTLALSMNRLGENPQDVVKRLLEKDASFCYQEFASLQTMIHKHSVSHHAYPVIHFYSNYDKASSISLNLAQLDEAISMLLSTQQGDKFRNELKSLRYSITHLLNQLEQSYSKSFNIIDNPEVALPEHDKIPEDEGKDGLPLASRRKILSALLVNEGLGWNDVYNRE